MTKPVYQIEHNVEHFIRDTFDASVTGNGTMELNTKLPAGAIITRATSVVTTAFDGTSPVLTVGTNASSYNDILASGDITEGTLGGYDSAADIAQKLSADTSVYAKLSSSGSSTTEGACDIVVFFVPDNS